MSKQALIEELVTLLGADFVASDADSLRYYGLDRSTVFTAAPLAIVFPTSTAQVQALVRWANKNLCPLVPSGGRTGLSGAAVAANGEVVVSFQKMQQILAFNATDRTVTCQPGVITAQLQTFAEEHGLYYPVDFASAGSSHIAGNISTNAGGIKVIRYGMTRDWVAGLKIVTGQGELLSLNNALVKNATGYDLRHLFIGAEGTLGFIVEATMRLTDKPCNLTAMVLASDTIANIMAILQHFQAALSLTAFEFFSDEALAAVLKRDDAVAPFTDHHPLYVLLEFEAFNQAALDQAASCFEHCLNQGWANDAVISQNLRQYNNLWKLRELISETLAPRLPYKNDISVKVSDIPVFLAQVNALVEENYPTFEVIWYGHIGDGNLHLNIIKPQTMAQTEFLQHCQRVNQHLFAIVQQYQGSISAEHGVGLLKRDDLHYSRSAEEITTMRAIKSIFDPHNILNPGKIF